MAVCVLLILQNIPLRSPHYYSTFPPHLPDPGLAEKQKTVHPTLTSALLPTFKAELHPLVGHRWPAELPTVEASPLRSHASPFCATECSAWLLKQAHSFFLYSRHRPQDSNIWATCPHRFSTLGFPLRVPLSLCLFLQSPGWFANCWVVPSGASRVKYETGPVHGRQGEMKERGRPRWDGR